MAPSKSETTRTGAASERSVRRLTIGLVVVLAVGAMVVAVYLGWRDAEPSDRDPVAQVWDERIPAAGWAGLVVGLVAGAVPLLWGRERGTAGSGWSWLAVLAAAPVAGLGFAVGWGAHRASGDGGYTGSDFVITWLTVSVVGLIPALLGAAVGWFVAFIVAVRPPVESGL